MITHFLSKLIKKARLSSIRASTIHHSSKIEAGSNVLFSRFDRHSFCGYDCDIYYSIIGSFTSIASGVVVGGAGHPIEWVGMSPVFYKGRDSVTKKFSNFELNDPLITIIGHDVWIGRSAIIKSGITIGNGAVIGAGSVVTKDVPPYAIYAGNPATLIRYRFSRELASALESTKWWLLDDANLGYLSQFIKQPERFLKEFYSLGINVIKE